MAENAMSTIRATFETREAADLAVEHLVQQHGIARPDIFIQSASNENTTGTESSRGDVSRSDAPTKVRLKCRSILRQTRCKPSNVALAMSEHFASRTDECR